MIELAPIGEDDLGSAEPALLALRGIQMMPSSSGEALGGSFALRILEG
jgi:hypothetical protein